ncbi:MAG: hypothetical protein K2K28_01440, partial [Clostridia bacterium]|nr:hypothetical protein [Clostridia bacterium]
MSKIFYKVNDKKDKKDKSAENSEETVDEAAADVENAQTEALDGTETGKGKKKDEFNKEKIIKYFKRHPKKTVNSKVERFSPRLNKGLSTAQV